MLVRTVRDEDWEACLEVDATYETNTAWQMEEHISSGEWRVTFREIRLPRTLRIRPTTPPEDLLSDWQRRDQFWVAVERRQVIGYLGLDIDQDRHQARVTELVVTPEHRRKGVASELLEHAQVWCLRHRIHQLVLVCSLKAQPGLAFALSHGFSFCGFQDGYWPGQEMALLLRQRLR